MLEPGSPVRQHRAQRIAGWKFQEAFGQIEFENDCGIPTLSELVGSFSKFAHGLNHSVNPAPPAGLRTDGDRAYQPPIRDIVPQETSMVEFALICRES
jgi:hypothetical protein